MEEIENLVSYDEFDMTSINILDASPYSILTLPITDVHATRFRFASVNSINQVATGCTQLLIGVEYIVNGTGSIVIDTKTFTTGDIFVLETNVTVSPPSTVSIDQTGYFVPVTDFVPSEDPYATFVPSQCGQALNVIFNDSINTGIYEIYTTQTQQGITISCSTPTRFIVKGEALGKIEISGVVYRTGEVFIQSADFIFVDSIGTNSVCQYYGSGTFYFMTYYYANSVYEKYIQTLCGNSNDQNLQTNFLAVHTLLHSNIINYEKNINVNLQGMQNNLDQINNNYALINPFN